MFYFRLNRVAVFNNKDGKLFGFLGKDKSKVQFASLVISDGIGLPDLSGILDEIDPAKRKVQVAEAVKGVASSIVFTPVDDIKDNSEITFGDTGVLIHKAVEIPESFSWEFLAIKLNKDARDLGSEVLEVINDKAFDEFANSFPALVGTAATAPFTAAAVIGKFIFKIFGGNLAKKKDKQLGILETSFIRELDYQNGIREGRAIKDETGNLRIDYTIFGHQ
jgi:hypothetical protein